MNTGNSHYSSRLGAIVTMVGVAVGLGNVWRFPYMMGSYGGSAFLLMYLLFTLFFAFPALVSEMSLGKRIATGTLDAFSSIFRGIPGKIIGYFFIVVVTIAGSYYAVVVANVTYTAVFSLFYGFSSSTAESYQSQLGNGALQYFITVLLIVAALTVSYLGLKRGIERISKVIMPLFLVSILYLIGYTWSLPGTLSNVREFLRPDFASIGYTELYAALGQAFFSIGLGGTFVVVYSGYIKKKEEIPRIAIFTCLGDLGSSLLVSLFLVPTILVFGLKMDAGPSLIFNTLPTLFEAIPGGRWVGSLFLFALTLVAFLSLVAAFQVPLSSLVSKFKSYLKFLIGFGVLQLFLTIPSAFFPEIIGPLDLIFGSGMQVLGSMLVVVGIWWGFRKEYSAFLFSKNPGLMARLAIKWMRWVIPVILFLILVSYLIDSI